jgi:hypothetical protein
MKISSDKTYPMSSIITSRANKMTHLLLTLMKGSIFSLKSPISLIRLSKFPKSSRNIITKFSKI